MYSQVSKYIFKKKGLLTIVFLVLVILGSVIVNTLYNPRNDDPVLVQEERLDAVQYDSFKDIPEIADAKTKVQLEQNFTEVEIQENFSESEVARINLSSYVYESQARSILDVSSTYSEYGYNLKSSGELVVFEGVASAEEFIKSHVEILNTSLPENSSVKFTSIVVSQKLLGGVSDSELTEVNRLEDATHRSTVYQIRFREKPFFIDSKSSNISVVTNLSTGVSRLTMANFFPTKLTQEYLVEFVPRSYTLIPGIPETPEFLNYYVNNDVVLEANSFLTTSESGSIIYVFSSGSNLFFPMLSKSAILKANDFSELSNRNYFLMLK